MLSTSGSLSGIQSPLFKQKRKREGENILLSSAADATRLRFRSKQTHAKQLLIRQQALHGTLSTIISPEGDLLLAHASDCTYFPLITSREQPDEIKLPRKINDRSTITTIHSSQDVTYVATCSREGLLEISCLDSATGHSPCSIEFPLQFPHPDEVATAMHGVGPFHIICSSYGSVFVVHRRGSRFFSALDCTQLTPKANVLIGLLQTGFKLFGLSSDAPLDPEKCIFKILHIPNSNFLMTCGSVLTLWSEWMEEGHQAQVLWELPFHHIIEEDVAKSFHLEDVEKLILHDVLIVQTTSTLTTAILAVLSSSVNTFTTPDNTVTRSLYLHVFDLALSAAPNAYLLKTRILLDSAVLVASPADNRLCPRLERDHGSASSAGGPPLYSIAPGRVSVVWESSTTRALQAVSLDLSSLLALSQCIDISSFAYEFDSGLYAEDIRAMAAVHGHDSIVVVTKDFVLDTLTPLFFDYQTRLRDLQKAASPTAARTTLEATPRDVLLQAISGELQLTESTTAHLTRRFQQLPLTEVRTAVSEVSEWVVNRCPIVTSEREEGTPSSRHSESGMQLVHKQLRDKFRDHQRLVEAVSLLGVPDVHQDVLLRNHQDIGTALGLCDAIAELVTRAAAPAVVDHSTDAAASEFLSKSHSASIKIVERGMQQFVKDRLPRGGGGSESLLSSYGYKGLTVNDVFFDRARDVREGLLALSLELLRTKLDTLSQHATDLLASAFGIIAIFANTLASVSAETYPGARHPRLAVMASIEARRAVHNVMTCFKTAVESVLSYRPAATSSTVSVYLEKTIGFRAGREGLRVRDLVSLWLEGYDLEYLESSSASEFTTAFEEEYEEAKSVGISILHTMGYHKYVFQLSMRFSYYRGLLLSFDQGGPEDSFLLEFQSLLLAQGETISTATYANTKAKITLSEFCLQTLWDTNRHALILDLISYIAPTTLQMFLADKPSLSWILSVRLRDYSAAVEQTYARASALTQLNPACTMLSISKLAARAAEQSPSSNSLVQSVHSDSLALSVQKRMSKDVSKDAKLSNEDTILKILDCLSAKELPVKELTVLAGDCVVLMYHSTSSSSPETEARLLQLWTAVVAMESDVWTDITRSAEALIDSASLESALEATALTQVLQRAGKEGVVTSLIPGLSTPLHASLALKVEELLGTVASRFVGACIAGATHRPHSAIRGQ